VLLDGHLPEHGRLLRQVGNPRARAPVHRKIREVALPEAHDAFVGAHEADDDREGRRLAGSVRAEQADDLARADRERDAPHDRSAAVGLDETVGGQHRTLLEERDFGSQSRFVLCTVTVLPPSGAVTSTLRPRSVIVKVAPTTWLPSASVTRAGLPSRTVRTVRFCAASSTARSASALRPVSASFIVTAPTSSTRSTLLSLSRNAVAELDRARQGPRFIVTPSSTTAAPVA